MQGGLKVYRGTAAAARHYVEADHSRVDDYYLAEGTGLAERFTASPESGVLPVGTLDGDGYEAWVAGLDPDTGAPRGRLRSDASAVRFVEVVVNGPKTWSLAAALHPEVAAAYDAAMDSAASQIIGWLAEHATTRVGPRGRQVQVPAERLEAVTVRHYTSRAGDPHRHLHLQANARVFAAGAWRGLHTVGVRDSLEAINGIGHAAMLTDPQFRSVLASHGYTVDPATGELRELARFVGSFSARAQQITRNVDRYETQWRDTHPGQEPGPQLRRAWDARAWAEARPDKVVPTNGAELVERWTEELRALGYRDPGRQLSAPLVAESPRPVALDRDQAVEVVVARLGARRSAWNRADIRGGAERWIAATGLVTDPAVRIELAEDLTDRAAQACVPLLERSDVPEHVRALSSPEVLAVEADLVTRLAQRADRSGNVPVNVPLPSSALSAAEGAEAGESAGLDPAQADAVAALAGGGALLVIEGAAGSGKTRTLAAAREALASRGHQMVVVTPTLKAARVAESEVGAGAFSAAWLAHQHGWRWDPDGHWTRVPSEPSPEAVLRPGDLLLVDEAGMLDQDTARALLTIADETGARVALMGDRHQLPAVGRGGVLDLAVRWATPEARVHLDIVHRFSDPQYAALTLAMRTGTAPPAAPPAGLPAGYAVDLFGEAGGERADDRAGLTAGLSSPCEATGARAGEGSGEVFDALFARGQIRVYPTDAQRTQALAEAATTALLSSGRGTLVMADTHDQVAALNGAIRDRLVAAGHVDDTRAVTTKAGERLGVGDRVTTRRNDRALGVANRDTWTITGIADDGALSVVDVVDVVGTARAGTRTLPAGYVAQHVELAYATTVYGAQGETTHTGHLLLGEHTTGSAAYVGMTRGRKNNVAHLVAEDLDSARELWQSTFRRDPADLGPSHAALRAAEEVERYGPLRPLAAALHQLRGAWTTEVDLRDALRRTSERREAWASYGEAGKPRVAQLDAEIVELTDRLHAVTRRVGTWLNEPAIRALPTDQITAEHHDWLRQRQQDRQAALDAAQARENTQRTRRHDPTPGYMRTPDRGPGIGR